MNLDPRCSRDFAFTRDPLVPRTPTLRDAVLVGSLVAPCPRIECLDVYASDTHVQLVYGTISGQSTGDHHPLSGRCPPIAWDPRIHAPVLALLRDAGIEFAP